MKNNDLFPEPAIRLSVPGDPVPKGRPRMTRPVGEEKIFRGVIPTGPRRYS